MQEKNILPQLLKPDIKELIANRQWHALKDALADWYPSDVAELLLDLEKSDRVLLYRAIPRHLAADVFANLEPQHQNALLIDLTDQETRQLLADMSPDDRTDLLEELPAEVTRELLDFLSIEDLKEARWLMGYPEESIGRLMTPDYIAVRPEWTIRQALDHIRKNGRDSETINMIYVVDEQGRLMDDLKLRWIILGNPDDKVESVMNRFIVSLSAFDDREEAARKMKLYDLVALPVVDSDGFLLGIVTIDDVLDVAEEEATEDIQKAASVSPLRMSYQSASVFTLYKKRIVWLTTLIFVNLLSSGVIHAYQETLATVISLAFFIPLLIGTGGNAGSQSATLMIRALVTGEVRLNQWARTVLKEFSVGIFLGVSLGILSSVLGLVRGGAKIGLVVGLTMILIVVAANLIGMTLPFVLARLKLDPAAASSPLVATLVDACGLLIYFSIAIRVLGLPS
jgi:magnesium transporter